MANGHEIANPVMVQIRVKGNLDHRRSDWFDGFAIEPRPNDETLLSGAVVDQAASYDILLKLHDLRLPLLSFRGP